MLFVPRPLVAKTVKFNLKLPSTPVFNADTIQSDKSYKTYLTTLRTLSSVLHITAFKNIREKARQKRKKIVCLTKITYLNVKSVCG